MKDCPYRITNIVGQHICSLSSYYMRGRCCEQISEETCEQMKELQRKFELEVEE